MIYLKRLWNLIAIIFAVCFSILISPLSFIIEIFVITPILYILTAEIYIEKYEPFSVRVMWWLVTKMMFITNKK